MRNVILAALFLCSALPVKALARPAPKGCLALSFDDGPSGQITQALLDGLAERDVKCTFFVCGYRIEEYPQSLCRIAEAGHELGLHGYRHETMNALSEDEVLRELRTCQKTLEKTCGVSAELFRPPCGCYNDTVLAAAEELGLPVILWSVDPEDWNAEAYDGVTPAIVQSAENGSVILMHELSMHSVRCALEAIDRLKEQGYEFCTVSELAQRSRCALMPGKVYRCFPPAEIDETE